MKKGVSAIVATVFLIMISITAIAVVYWTVIPFIKGNLDLDQRKVDLQIITTNGYTLYDKDQGIAYVQIARGVDNVTLHGMEVMIDFDGITYKTTLRAPNTGESKSYFFDMTDMRDKALPRTVSVAPVFILDARQVLGQITSQIAMPILNIVKNYTDIVIELRENNEPIINITEEVKEQSNLCDTTVGEDPWGGCPIARGQLSQVGGNAFGKKAYIKENIDTDWTHKWLKFKYLGDGESLCILTENSEVYINQAIPDPSDGDDYFSLPATSVFNVSSCPAYNYYYVYNDQE